MGEIKERHLTYWQNSNGTSTYPSERYVVLFSTWDDMPRSRTCTKYETLDEALEEIKLINKLYTDTPKPQKNYHDNGKLANKGWYGKYQKYDWDFSNGAYFWGYALLDMQECKFVKVVNGFHYGGFSIFPKNNDLSIYDFYFRKDNEIPFDFTWDKNEYDGWLQFRWGDGKNAIGYVDSNKKERPGVDEWWDIYDEATDTYKRQKVRVVYVDWNDPLPKKEKGIKYLRPNKEPVIFPGEFGYDVDTSINEWALQEELAGDEYLNKGGTFDKQETTSSIADILGDNNPLLKLLNK